MNTQPPQMTFEQVPVRRRRSRLGCTCAVLGTLLGVGGGVIGIVVAALSLFAPNMLNGFFANMTGGNAPETRAIVGDPAHFDAVAGYTQVAAFAGQGVHLTKITANQVRSDGTLDLTATYAAPRPSVDYQFMREIPRPDNAPPLGAGGNSGSQWYEPITISAYQPGQRRRITMSGNGVSSTFDFVNDGLTREKHSPTSSQPDPFLDSPTCSFADFWKIGLKQDFPKDAVATITYTKNGYDFSITGTQYRLKFDNACQPKAK